jgi:hypothetical protein
VSVSTAYGFPGFYTPYFSLLTFPVAGFIAVAAKFFCYRRFSDNPNRPDLTDIVFAICGSFLTGFLFILLTGNIIETLPVVNSFSLKIGQFISHQNFAVFIIISFSAACFLSIVAEFVALRFLTRDDKIENLFQISTIANITGYVLQGIIVWVWVAWIW